MRLKQLHRNKFNQFTPVTLSAPNNHFHILCVTENDVLLLIAQGKTKQNKKNNPHSQTEIHILCFIFLTEIS